MRSRPLLAYLDKKRLKAIRSRNMVSSGPIDGNRANSPVQCLQSLRLKHRLPSEEDLDAFYVAMMLAMAQSHIYGAAGTRPRPGLAPRFGSGNLIDNPPSGFTDMNVHFMTHSEERAELIVYQAKVTSTFLSRFANPMKSPPQDPAGPGLDITFRRVPIWPIERLAQALGPDIAGCAAREQWEEESNDIETWLDAETQNRGTTAAMEGDVKRRRQENSSLEESPEDASERGEGDVSVLRPDAKRRCTGAGRRNPFEVC